MKHKSLCNIGSIWSVGVLCHWVDISGILSEIEDCGHSFFKSKILDTVSVFITTNNFEDDKKLKTLNLNIVFMETLSVINNNNNTLLYYPVNRPTCWYSNPKVQYR